MDTWANRVGLLATTGAALLVLLLYAPALHAPFLAPKFAALEVTAALGFLAFALRQASPGGPRASRALVLAVVLVFATTALSWLAARAREEGAPYAVDALARWVSLLGLACGASVLSSASGARERLVHTITLAAGLVAALGLLQHAAVLPIAIPVISNPGSTFGNRNLSAEVIALALPFGLAALVSVPRGDSRVLVGVATAFELVYLAVTRARGAWVGGAVGLVCVLWLARGRCVWPSRRVVVLVLFAALAGAWFPGRVSAHDAGDEKRVAGFGALLDATFDAHSPALRTRLGLWRRSGAMVRDYPWTGVGPGNWPVFFPRYAEPDAARDGVLSATLAPRQAHDDLLEHAAETGVPGAIAMLLLVAAISRSARHRLAVTDEDSAVDIGAAGALVALVGVSVTGFPLEMPGTIALSGLALGLIAPVREPSEARAPARYVAVYAVVVAALALLVTTGIREVQRVRSSYWLGVAERALHRDCGVNGADEALRALAQHEPFSLDRFLVHLRTAQMEIREKRGGAAIEAAVSACALEPYSPNAWATLAEAHVSASQYEDGRHDAARALSLLHEYPLALFVSANAKEREHDDTGARIDRERLRQLASDSEDPATRRSARALLDGHE